jgi:hypothetical protein
MTDDKPCSGAGPFDCHASAEDHKFLLEVDYQYTDPDAPKDGDDALPGSASVQTHMHNINNQTVVQTLVLLAHNMLTDHMAHTTFKGTGNRHLAHAMAHAAATAYMAELIAEMPDQVDIVSTHIPNDISSLLEGE